MPDRRVDRSTDYSSCGYAKRRLPLLGWLRKYRSTWLMQDALAGLTVGLTAVPQGVAYGIVAGLNPEYGLYASFMSSFVYIIFGSCASITIGPTAIMATMVQPLVAIYGPSIAILIAFLKGCIIAVLGLCHLGFLLDFISLPVITGFTSAAAINIAASQFKSLLGIPGKSEGLLQSLIDIFSQLGRIKYQDSLLGLCTMIILYLLKNPPCGGSGPVTRKIARVATLSRNIIVVLLGTGLAYIFYCQGEQPFDLTGSMGHGLPPFALPPFSITSGNRTYDFLESTRAMGTTLFSISIVSTLQHVAVAKAFARGKSLDASQEMLALGICNILGSFVSSMPVTGSFTRTAVNHASGVKTTLGGFFTGSLVLLALGLLTSTFRFIPKATLAAIIISAMYYMLDFETYKLLWQAKKPDFFLMLATFVFCVFIKLEWGIIIGIAMNLIMLLYFVARPSIVTVIDQIDSQTVLRVLPEEGIAFPAAESIRESIMKLSKENLNDIVVDCRNLKRIDVTVVKSLKLLATDLLAQDKSLICTNCCESVEFVIRNVAPDLLDSLKDAEVAD